MSALEEHYRRIISRRKCERSHLFFCRYFFKHRQNIKFRLNWHHHLICDVIDDMIAGRKKNIAISISPGSSKTELVVINLIARGLALNPRARFLHLSGSDTLASLNSATARDIVRSAEFQALWPMEISQDADSKKRWNVEIDGKLGGGVYATAIGGQVTGFRAGHMAEGFQGAIICFPYDSLVMTDKGPISIGDLVENKIKAKVFSFNESTGQIELKEIRKYLKNTGSDIIEVNFSEGMTIECTPNHKVFTENRGWVQAKDLLSTDIIPFFESNKSLMARFIGYASFCRNLSRTFISKIMGIPKARWIPISVMIALKRRRNVFCDSFPNFPIFNGINQTFRNFKFIRNILNRIRRGKNFNHFGIVQNGPSCVLSRKVFIQTNRVVNIVSSRSISKIFNAIISFVAVNVSNFHSLLVWSYECLCNSLVNLNCFNHPVFCGSERSISDASFSFTKRNMYFFASYFSKFVSIFNNYISRQTPDSTYVRYFIKPIKTKKRSPLNISFIRHESSTYCLSVETNHNFFITKNQQALLVSNCDDPLKPEDSFSKTKLEAANRKLITTVKSRKANPDTPMILIMQRIAESDAIGLVQSGNLEGEWTVIKIPAVIDKAYVSSLAAKYQKLIEESEQVDGRFSYWPYKEPIQQLLTMERGEGKDQSGSRISRHVFNSQYQQAPTSLGGNIIKGEYFIRYKTQALPKLKWRKIYADTAQKTKESNDYSVFIECGLGIDGKAYLLDLIRGKWEAPELLKRAIAFWSKCKERPDHIYGHLRKMQVEDKASGTGLIQTLKIPPYHVPIEGVERDKDKLTRVMDALPYLESGQFCIPESASFTHDFISECEAFTADDVHDHDDQVDCLNDAVMDILSSQNKLKIWESLAER